MFLSFCFQVRGTVRTAKYLRRNFEIVLGYAWLYSLQVASSWANSFTLLRVATRLVSTTIGTNVRHKLMDLKVPGNFLFYVDFKMTITRLYSFDFHRFKKFSTIQEAEQFINVNSGEVGPVQTPGSAVLDF